MEYNFDTIIDRKGTNSLKWEPDKLKEFFGEEDMLPLWVADMDFKTPQPIIDTIVERAKHGIYGYSVRLDEYYDSVINWQKKRHNWNIEKDSIVYTPGIVPAINYIIQAFCSTGDKVIIQTPVYYPFKKSIINNGCKVVDNPLTYDGKKYNIDFEDFEEKAKDEEVKIFILCSPHNPVGRVWTKEELEKIGKICIENNVLVVSDEIHNDLILGNNEHIVFANISEEFAHNSIICTAPSKTFNIPGLETSHIIIKNKEIRDKYKHILIKNSISGHNPMSIAALKAAYNEGEDWLEQLLLYLEENLNFMENYLINNMKEVRLIRPQATYLAWLDFRLIEKDNKKLEDLIFHKAKVALDSGNWFGDNGSGFMRVNFACPRAILKEALDRICSAINNRTLQ
ncbi:MalY/PatB family protein [Vallitalea guaymasensis]|uniref:cysteine-S-conjugate beta-lyase n=1 Tax=Vallitalea guaymasensis TaxID=1185412 RepID=A0A8J8SEI5_9FIRM|nr:MalY/PatB family protein [Vallitalea guaymasensis]QUH31600.1 pyridoxal phosphate-dependent aminotransferase [Vallitalea guaymasensis]